MYPELSPASINQKYDTEIFQFATPEIEKCFRTILRSEVNKWAAHQCSTEDALRGREALEEQLKATEVARSRILMRKRQLLPRQRFLRVAPYVVLEKSRQPFSHRTGCRRVFVVFDGAYRLDLAGGGAD